MRYAQEGTESDRIACAQNTPVRVEYDPLAQSATAATVIVHTVYGMSSDNPIKVVADLNTLKLSDLVCLGQAETGDLRAEAPQGLRSARRRECAMEALGREATPCDAFGSSGLAGRRQAPGKAP